MSYPRPTIADVAQLANVSKTTVSRVMNNKRSVSWLKRQRVLQAIAQLNYQPNESARSLALGRRARST